MIFIPLDTNGPDASCEACVARLSVAAQSTELAGQQLQSIDDLLKRVTDCIGGVAGTITTPRATLIHSGSEEEQAGAQKCREAPTSPPFSVAPTDDFWRDWRATAEARSLFYRSGLSASLGAFEKAVTQSMVLVCVPRLQLLDAKVRGIVDHLECAGQRVLAEQQVGAAQGQWLADAVSALSQATCHPNSPLWANLKADFEALGRPDDGANAAACPSREARELYEGRLQQQRQRIVQLLRSVVHDIVCDSSAVDAAQEKQAEVQ